MSKIEDYQPAPILAYTKGEDPDALMNYSAGLAQASTFSPYINVDGYGTSLRPHFTRDDYDFYRPEDKVSTKHHDIMQEVRFYYERVGLISNVIDLMADFASRGITISHSNATADKFYKGWFSRINGQDRSERFLNNLYKYGNVIIQRKTGRVTKRAIKRVRQTLADLDSVNPKKKEIPLNYTFLNPAKVVCISSEEELYNGIRKYGKRKPVFSSPIGELNIHSSMVAFSNEVEPLSSEDLIVDFYKKDDWELWAKPIIYRILQDIKLLMKNKLVDLTILDSAISPVRIWKLGSLEHRIVPNAEAFNRLRNQVVANPGAGARDIFWGPDLVLEESVHKMADVLGESKYAPPLNAIYAGLGIPPSLTGTSEGGTTNNLISLKTLVKRLDYGRARLLKFWEHEIALVQRAMGFRQPAHLEFDTINFDDEAAERKLLIDLADRDIISHEWVQKKFNADPVIEKVRLNREYRDSVDQKRVPKSGPFKDGEFNKKIGKELLLKQKLTPSQINYNVPPPRGDDDFWEKPSTNEPNEQEISPSDQRRPAGRPKNAKDSFPRKSPRFNPVIRAKLIMAENQEKIAEYLKPVFQSFFNKKNIRSLTAEEFELAEKIKFAVLADIRDTDVTQGTVLASLRSGALDGVSYKRYQEMCRYISSIMGRPLTLDESRKVQIESLYDE